jgi:hypothetical protein
MSRMIFRKRSLVSRLPNSETSEVLHLADQEEQQRAEEQQELAGRRRDEGDHRQHEARCRGIDIDGAGIGAEQRGLQFVQRGNRPLEHCQPVLDDGADLRRAPDPFAHRAGEHGHGQA